MNKANERPTLWKTRSGRLVINPVLTTVAARVIVGAMTFGLVFGTVAYAVCHEL